MTERESYVHEWIEQLSVQHKELGGFAICPYASGSDTLIKDIGIDDIVPEPGYDVIIFIVEDFWKPAKIHKWVKRYNEEYPLYWFAEDLSCENTYINGIKTNNSKLNIILCQSKRKIAQMRKKLAKTDYYNYWNEDYLNEVLGDDVKLIEKVKNPCPYQAKEELIAEVLDYESSK